MQKIKRKLQKQQICLRLQGVNRSKKAYIYQQLVDFEPFLSPQATLIIEHHCVGQKAKKKHQVRITLMEGDIQLKADAQGGHLFDAVQDAKKNLIFTLGADSKQYR